MNRSRIERAHLCVGAAMGAVVFTVAGCGNGSSTSAAMGTGGSTSHSASHGASTTGTGGAASSAASTAGSTTGSAGTGGTGGGATKCLDASTYAAFFTLEDPSLCAVEVHVADAPLGFLAPSWGSHGGPLLVAPDTTGGGVTLTRWSAAAGPMGKLTKQDTHVDAKIPAGAFAGSQAIDLPFFGWTAISWAGAFPNAQGQIEMIKSGLVDKTFAVNGAYALEGVAASPDGGRLLYTGLSPIGAPTTDNNGFYAADACSAPTPDLGAGTGCSASALIAGWGDASGPVAVDAAGNAFVVLATSATGHQEARGFTATSVARGAGATAGTTLFTIPGFGTSLAALAPTASADGMLVFQPFDATSFAAVDVIKQPYKASGTLQTTGTTATLLKLPAMSPGVSFLVDDKDRLWVAASDSKSTTYVVFERVP